MWTEVLLYVSPVRSPLSSILFWQRLVSSQFIAKSYFLSIWTHFVSNTSSRSHQLNRNCYCVSKPWYSLFLIFFFDQLAHMFDTEIFFFYFFDCLLHIFLISIKWCQILTGDMCLCCGMIRNREICLVYD
jgi:hypothetical protein